MGIKMYGLHLGSFGLDLDGMLPGHPSVALEPGQTEKTKTWYQCPSIAYVIEHPEGSILFETGVSPHWKQEWPDAYKQIMGYAEVKTEDLLEAKLKSINKGPEDFDIVVMGHMHMDHAGGLRLFEDASAEIVLHEDEYRGIITLEEDGFFMSRADYEFLPRKKPTLVYGEQQLLKGIKLISVPGHTWGQMGMMVQLEHTGWVILASDAIHHHETYGPPDYGNMVSVSQEKWHASVEKIRRYATKYEATIAPGHSMTGVKQHADGTKEFVKLDYYPGQVYE
jgi:glyoxylase-like metal-dependent hydrolase (beta-lactamase superfamily II)